MLYPKAITRNDLKTIQKVLKHILYSFCWCVCFKCLFQCKTFVVHQDDCRILWDRTSLVLGFVCRWNCFSSRSCSHKFACDVGNNWEHGLVMTCLIQIGGPFNFICLPVKLAISTIFNPLCSDPYFEERLAYDMVKILFRYTHLFYRCSLRRYLRHFCNFPIAFSAWAVWFGAVKVLRSLALRCDPARPCENGESSNLWEVL